MSENKNPAIEKVENVIDEKAQERAHKKAMRNQEKNQRERLKNQRKIELARIRENEIARKNQAKSEARKERDKRKAERLISAQRVRENREERKRLKIQNRQKNKEHGRNHSGWLAAVITLGVSTLALATALGFTLFTPSEPDKDLEASYTRAFYDAVEQVDNIDLNLSKVLASSDSGAKQLYLLDLAVNSELAEADLQELPLKDENKFYTTKLINQIGDYAKYLNKKLVNGEDFSAEDVQNLKTLYEGNLKLKESLSKMSQKMTNGFSFSKMNDENSEKSIIEDFNSLQNLSVEYPELIYDGPFSDGQNTLTVKGLSGEEINSIDAERIFKYIFADRNLQEVSVSENSNSRFNCFNAVGKTEKGEIYAEISKKGGKLIMFDYAGSCEEVNYQTQDAIDSATEFLLGLGLRSLSPVWVNLNANVYTINFASEIDGVIIYPDMVKVRVCAETNQVIGLEASSYYANHTQRELSLPAISKQTAAAKVNPEMQIESVRLCVCPVGLNLEKLCYEISGEVLGNTYYVYIDAVTGRQVEMFKVIESTEGTLLM
ncbi:MAG: germination protein YpeB [Clostridia bacterium]|nr:germination protein YpeB [Clostridia bacterium]